MGRPARGAWPICSALVPSAGAANSRGRDRGACPPVPARGRRPPADAWAELRCHAGGVRAGRGPRRTWLPAVWRRAGSGAAGHRARHRCRRPGQPLCATFRSRGGRPHQRRLVLGHLGPFRRPAGCRRAARRRRPQRWRGPDSGAAARAGGGCGRLPHLRGARQLGGSRHAGPRRPGPARLRRRADH